MDGVAESEHHAPSLDISPAPTHQQGMSPSHAGATAGFDAQSNAGDTLVVAGSQGVSNEGVAMRAMAVSVTTGQNPGAMSWPVEGAYGTGADPRGGAPDVRQETYEHMNAAQASWSVMSTRRTAPAWIQRLGAFFQEMRAQQAPQSMWAPSPLASPPQGGRRAIASPESEQGSWPSVGRGEHPLLSREQREQLQRMERRAPLLYGPQGQDRHEASSGGSGGSTYEAVQEEVRRQLRGVVEQLEASRQEASELRREVVRLKSAQATEDPTAVVLTAPRGPSTGVRRLPGRLSEQRRSCYFDGAFVTCRIFFDGGIGHACGRCHKYAYLCAVTCRSFYVNGAFTASRIFFDGGIGLTCRGFYINGAFTASRIFFHGGDRAYMQELLPLPLQCSLQDLLWQGDRAYLQEPLLRRQ